MKLIAIMPCRNEDWCIGLTARAVLQWCDELVVLDHASTDDTGAILEEIQEQHPERVTILREPDGAWTEMSHRQRLLDVARMRGASHIATVDADEILTSNLIAYVRGFIERADSRVVELPGFNLRETLYRYHNNGIWGKRFFAVGFQDAPWLHWSGDQFHHREPFTQPGHPLDIVMPLVHAQGGIMHLWGVSDCRLRAKHALYKLTERLRFPEKPLHEIEFYYNLWAKPLAGTGPWSFERLPGVWWEGYDLSRLHPMRLPWQIAECHKILKEHGPRTFEGLDLFGIA